MANMPQAPHGFVIDGQYITAKGYAQALQSCVVTKNSP